MSAIPCPLPKVTNPSDPSQENHQEVYVYDPQINKWIRWKSSNNKNEVHKGCRRPDKEEKNTSVSSEICTNRKEDTKNCAVERKLSDWLIPDTGDTLEEPKMRPMWDKTGKKKPKRCFGTTEKETEQEVCQSMKHFLDIPCLSLKSLQDAVSEKGHHIPLDDRYCKTEKEIKNSSCKSSKGTRSRGTRVNDKDPEKRCRIIKRHLWQMVDENGKPLPFGAVSSRRNGLNDEKRNGADIWIRLDCVSALITNIMEEMRREQGDLSETKESKCEMHVASEENSSLDPTEDTEFVEIPLERSSSKPHSCPLTEKPDISSESCRHEDLMTESSTDDSLPHPNQTLNSIETQSSSISHEGSGSSEIQITSIHPSTSSSSKSQDNVSSTEMSKIDAVGNRNEHSHREPAVGFKRESRHRRLFSLFSSFSFRRWHDRRARKTRLN